MNELKEWIAEHRPELDARLWALGLDEIREVLNQVTGLNVSPNELVETGSQQFLEALKNQG